MHLLNASDPGLHRLVCPQQPGHPVRADAQRLRALAGPGEAPGRATALGGGSGSSNWAGSGEMETSASLLGPRVGVSYDYSVK